MFRRLKKTLVESYIGAIGLGYLLAQTMLHAVGIISAPVADWITQREWGTYAAARGYGPHGFLLQYAVPELIRSVGLLVIWYVMVRWLYFTPLMAEDQPQTESQLGS